jgi:predicted  nucleic acid-binding Zn-ribbon protein
MDDSLCRIRCDASEHTFGHQQHKHQCESCHTTWKHADDLPDQCPTKEFALAHTCPECGKEQFLKHWTDAEHRQVRREIAKLDPFTRLFFHI